MSKPYINYHFDYTWHGRSYSNSKAYPVGTSVDLVKADWGPHDDTFKVTHRTWDAWAWPGGYEIHYYTKDCGVLCHQCANKELPRTLDPDDEQFFIVAQDVHWEGPPIQCDHCNRDIESQYGDPEAEENE